MLNLDFESHFSSSTESSTPILLQSLSSCFEIGLGGIVAVYHSNYQTLKSTAPSSSYSHFAASFASTGAIVGQIG